MSQGAIRPETPLERRERERLEADLQSSPVRGMPLQQRPRNFRPDPESGVRALGGPTAWMRRLRAIEDAVDPVADRAALESFADDVEDIDRASDRVPLQDRELVKAVRRTGCDPLPLRLGREEVRLPDGFERREKLAVRQIERDELVRVPRPERPDHARAA